MHLTSNCSEEDSALLGATNGPRHPLQAQLPLVALLSATGQNSALHGQKFNFLRT
jgi:hypothetical protein